MNAGDELDLASMGDAPEKALKLERLVGRFVDRLTAGESIDPAKVLAEEPELGREVLKELETFLALGAPDRPSTPLGSLGEYELRRQLGRGGMGIVYEAWQASMDRRVALKVLPAALASDQKSLMRFLREARSAGKLSHPNIVAVHAMGIDKGVPYFVMELIEGETLAQMLVRLRGLEGEASDDARRHALEGISRLMEGARGSGAHAERGDLNARLPERFEVSMDPGRSSTLHGTSEVDLQYSIQVAKAFAGAAEGLHHAHSRGVVHRDLKPSNLILDLDGRLRILDFGLARLEGQESLTRSGDFVGTPLYMSPEQARGGKTPVDHRTDIYSLGATMYAMLALKPPFHSHGHGHGSEDILSSIQTREPRPLRKVNARVPKDFETIVLKCLRKDPDDRYRTAEALAQDLWRFTRGDPIEARAEGAWEKLARHARRHRIQLAAVAVLVILLTVIGWLTWSQARERRLRAVADYPGAVLRALEKLQAGSLRLKAESGDPLSIDPRAQVFGTLWVQGVSGQSMQPLQSAVLELGEVIASVPDKPDAWFHRARGRYLLGDFKEALADLDGALRASPSFVPAWMLQAAIHDLRGEKEAARRHRERASSVDGVWQRAWLSARQALAEKRWEDAARSHGELVRLGSEGQEPHIGAAIESCLGRAGALLELKDTTGALQHIAVARYLWPASVEPALLEGKALWLAGEVEKAAQVFLRTYEAAPYKDEVAIAVFAICLHFQAEEQALAWAEQVRIESVRERLRAGCLLELRRCEEAVQAARKAIALDRRDVYAHVYLAVALYDCLGEYEEALVQFEAARDLAPGSAHVRFHLGRCFWFWGKLDQAIEHYRRAVELDPTDAIVQADLAIVLILQGKSEEGEPLLNSAVELDPWNPYVHNDKAIGLELLGRQREALAACDDAIRVKPELSWPYARRGKLLEKEGKLDEAIEEYRKACPLTPRELSHYQSLGRLLAATGKPQEALAAYVEALGLGLTHALTHCRIARLVQGHGPAVAGQDAGRLSKLLDAALEKVLHDLDKAESEGKNDDRLVGSLVWILSSLQAIRASDQSLFALLPRLPPYAAIDALLGFEKHPPPMESATASSRASYLEARLLERSGQRTDAVAKLAALEALDPASPEPALALARSLRADDPARAESELRQVLVKTRRGGAKDLWDLWAAIALNDVGRDPASLLESFPAASPAAVAYGEDLRWLLERLRDGAAIRIDSGGVDSTSPDGTVWSRDRFFTGGRGATQFVGDIAGTDAVRLYHSQRSFPEERVVPTGYRLPVPSGRYRVRLHFAETYWRVPGMRRFDVRIEGHKVLAGCEPIARGFAAASVESFVAAVDDGLLDIELVPVAGAPEISAVEIERED